MRPDKELLDLFESKRNEVYRHGGWRSAPDRIAQLLRTVTRFRQMMIDGRLQNDAPWESVLAYLIRWHHEIPTGTGAMSEDDAAEIGLAALAVARVDSLELAVRRDGYKVRKSGGTFVLRHRWNPAIEVADMLLEQAVVPSIPEPTPSEVQWVESCVAWREAPPMEVLEAAAGRAARTISAYRSALPEGALPDSFDLGDGLTVGDACEILAGLMGLADLCEYAARQRRRTETTLMQLERGRLVNLLSDLSPSCSIEQVSRLVDRLSFRQGRSPRSSPLVAVGGALIISPPLIGSRLVEPLVLRSAAYDPSEFGSIGHELGRQVSGWVDWLSSIPDVLVATEVKLVAPGGRTMGDLDIVAVDPVSATVVCLELKSPIEPWSWIEVGKAEDLATRGAEQIARRRGQLADGSAVARLPREWPDLNDFTWTWAVGFPQQLCVKPPTVPDVSVTSLRYVLSLGSPPDLSSVSRMLRDPPLPIEGVHYSIEARTIDLGRAVIRVDCLGVNSSTVFKPTYPVL